MSKDPRYVAVDPAFDSDEEGMERDEEMDEEEAEQIGHMQEVVDRLWIGDIHAAEDEAELKKAGITAILSIIRQKVKVPAGIRSLPLPLDDSPETDILTHLPQCVEWIQSVLSEEGSGGILVHCQAGMSRSATVVAAYLMKTKGMTAQEAVDLLREKRPVVYPSETFQEQLLVYEAASCRVSIRDKQTRQWYMERTVASVVNQGEWPDDARIAKFPATPTASHPGTPPGAPGRRKIRCKNCRRQLATREHMMEHILSQSPTPPLSRPRTPSTGGYLPSPLTSLSSTTGESSNQDSSTSRSTKASVSSISGGLTPLTTSGEDTALGRRLSQSRGVTRSASLSNRPTAAGGPAGPGNGRRILDAETLASRLPPQLAALRAGVPGSLPPPAPVTASPSTTPTSATVPLPQSASASSAPVEAATWRRRSSNASLTALTRSPATITDSPEESAVEDQSDSESLIDRKAMARKLSMSALTPAIGDGRRSSNASENGKPAPHLDSSSMTLGRRASLRSGSSTPGSATPYQNYPILVNPACSGYFVEPLTWMERFLAEGQLSGKIVCPNEKCNAKIGSYDWAGMQCGCKEWVVPGFCIHRSKVDEVW